MFCVLNAFKLLALLIQILAAKQRKFFLVISRIFYPAALNYLVQIGILDFKTMFPLHTPTCCDSQQDEPHRKGKRGFFSSEIAGTYLNRLNSM